MNDKRNKTNERGAALLVVLFIVMVITVLSLGFLSRSDVELACGENMILKTQMDYLAESGLVHAKGLVLSPQDVDSEYWSGDVRQQLITGSDDYYDVDVVRNDPNYCNYFIPLMRTERRMVKELVAAVYRPSFGLTRALHTGWGQVRQSGSELQSTAMSIVMPHWETLALFKAMCSQTAV